MKEEKEAKMESESRGGGTERMKGWMMKGWWEWGGGRCRRVVLGDRPH